MSTERRPTIGLVISERDRLTARELEHELRSRSALSAVAVPTPGGELGYTRMAESAPAQAASAFAGADLCGVLFASSAAECLLAPEGVDDLCGDLADLAGAPASGVLSLLKAEVKRLGIERPVLLSSFDWPLTLMLRSELLREGVLVPHMACLFPADGTETAEVPAQDVADFVLQNLPADADGVVFVGENARSFEARRLLAGRLAIPMITSTGLLVAKAEAYLERRRLKEEAGRHA